MFDEVGDRPSHPISVFGEHAEAAVAQATEQSANPASLMFVIHPQKASASRRPATDGADAPLGGE